MTYVELPCMQSGCAASTCQHTCLHCNVLCAATAVDALLQLAGGFKACSCADGGCAEVAPAQRVPQVGGPYRFGAFFFCLAICVIFTAEAAIQCVAVTSAPGKVRTWCIGVASLRDVLVGLFLVCCSFDQGKQEFAGTDLGRAAAFAGMSPDMAVGVQAGMCASQQMARRLFCCT